jgi:hypothetical protein
VYPEETLYYDDDNGTMVDNVQTIRDEVVGHKIVDTGWVEVDGRWGGAMAAFFIRLDNGKEVVLKDTGDCCAYTALQTFLFHADKIDHIITGVGTTGGYTTWHIFADLGDVLELTVGWSSGNPFYYGYGFDIEVRNVSDLPTV